MKHFYISTMLLLVMNATAQDCADPVNTGETGCVTFTYMGETVQYTTVMANDGNIWLQQNLGSTQVSASLTDTDAYGDLFQWGRWDDGHQLRTSTVTSVLPEPNNPTGLGTGTGLFYGADPEWWNTPGDVATTDTWDAPTPAEVTATNGCDPCKALGAGWHLPTQQEWIDVIAAEPITGQASGFDSNLKIAAAGQRSYTGNLSSVGVRAYMWSSTPSDNTDYAKYYYLTSITNNPNAGGFREQGSSVRCLKPAAVAGIHNAKIKKASIYPNPVTNDATIQSVTAVDYYEVYSITGSLMQKGKGNTIAFAKLPNGLYIVKIILEDGATQAIKVVKN